MSVLVLVVLAVCTFIWFNETIIKKNKKFLDSLPGPPRLPIIGNAHQFIKGSAVEFLAFVHNCQQTYGRRYVRALGPYIAILLTDPKDVEVVLSSNELIDKAFEYTYLHPWLGLGLLTSTGERWRRHRKFLTPSFHFSILRHFVTIFDRRTDSFVNRISELADGNPVDIYPLVTRCTLDQLSESAMGTSTEEQTEQNLTYVAAVKQLSLIINERMKNIFLRADITFRFSNRYPVFMKALKIVQDYTNTVIEQRRKTLIEQGAEMSQYTKNEDEIGSKTTFAFLDLLLLSELDGKKLEDTAIRNEVDTFMFEGHDTTASGISFTLYLLAQNTTIQEKLYQEQVNIFENDPHRPTSLKDLQEMKYLDLAIKEAIRIYPSVPFVARLVKHQTKINDLTIPAHTNVIVNIFSMNRDPGLFPKPLEFIPERFLPEEVSKRHPYSNVTFSAGPRNCIGQKFAMYEMKMTLSKFMRNYRVESADMPPLRLACDLVLKSANGVHVRMYKRANSKVTVL